MDVDYEVVLLVEELKRIGTPNSQGKISVKFGILVQRQEDDCSNLSLSLVGTLRAAKRKKIIKYDGEILLQGVHDNVEIVLLKED